MAAVLLFASSKCWVHRNWFRCRLDAAFTKLCVDFGVRLVPTPLTPAASDFLHNSFTMLHISHCGAGGNFADLLSGLSSSESEGSLRVSPGIWKPTSCVWLWTCCSLSLSTTPGYMSLQKLFHSAVSRPGIGVCWQCFTVISGLIEVFQCFSTPYMTWGTRVNDFDTWTGIINIHMKSFPGQFLALAYTVFPVFPDHLEIDSTNWTITVASLTQLMLSQRCTWANHISISNCEVEAGRVEQDSGVPDVVPALKPSPYSACPEPLW